MSFASSYKQLNKSQKQAVDTLEGPVMVIAGPGTGKTQLLALRAANILQKTDTLPQNILCLTYTEVGARNMRDRLTRYIGQQAYDIRISTYHGFGSELIRQYGEYFNEYGAEQPVDKLGQDAIMHEIYAELPATNPLWRAEVYLKDALSFISECKRNRIEPEHLRLVGESNLKFIADASDIAATTLQNVQTMGKGTVPAFTNLLPKLQSFATSKPLPGDITHLANLCVNDLSNALASFEATSKTNDVTAFKNKWLLKNSKNQWALAGTKETKKILGGADIYEKYLQKLIAKKLFDYDDMILRAIKALQQHDDLRFTLHEQYQYIMLDEFQDTNLAQLSLIELLTNNPVNAGRPNILAVGDDDQAIFSFQGADLTNMLRFFDMYKNVETITLTENWRSHPDILHTAHGIAGQIEDRLHRKLGVADKVLTAKNSKLPKDAVVQRHEFKSDIAQYDWVAKQVDKLIKNGTPPHEVAVLAPKHKFLEPLIPYLNARGVPIRYDKRENVLDDVHINYLLRMAELIESLAANDESRADSIWPSVLSAEFWQIPTSTIWQLSWQANENRYKEGAETHWQALMMQDKTLQQIALFFAKLALLANNETLETMLDFITGVEPLTLHEENIKQYTSPYFEYYFGQHAMENTPVEFTNVLSNLTVLRQNLRKYGKGEDRPLVLADLLQFVTEYRNAGEKLLNTSPYHSAESAVQIMTAYGSKGLEFGAVFTVATQDEAWGMKSRGQSSNITLPQNLSLIRQAGSSKDERKRLFYVALTRAKHTLYLTSYAQDYAGKESTHLEFLAENDEQGHCISPLLPTKNQQIIASDNQAPVIEALDYFWTSRHIAGLQQPKLMDLTKPKLDSFQLSATHLNNFTDLVYGGPQMFFLNSILRFPSAPTADGQYGNAIHETLETMHKILRSNGELPDVDEAVEIFTQKLRAKRLSEADFKRQHSRGVKALQVFLPQWWHNFTPDAEHEKSFRNEGAFIGDAHLSGNMDQLLIDKKLKRIRVVDFKTGKGYSRWNKSELKLHKYKQQLLFYKLLIEASHSYKGYLVNEGKLVFVEPNDDNEIDELDIAYSIDDLERTKKLIAAVWQRIQSLDFPDTSNFSADLKGTIAFEDWLIENS